MATLKYWLWLSTRQGLRPEDCCRLLERFGTPEAAYFADPGEYEQISLFGARKTAMLDKSLEGTDYILGQCDRLGVRVLTLQDAEYPARLKEIFDPPCVLYVKGKTFAFDEVLTIGVVGAREPSPYGVAMAGALGRDLARSGALVVSGIAQGLDSAALRGALWGGGPVVSVLGNGVDVIYPRENAPLYEDVATVGALISEYPPGTPTEGRNFPVRNRIISGLSTGVVAVEARERSGTLITARLALDQNRDVFAFPGPANAPMSGGTNRLIQRGEAKLILSAQDVLCEYEGLYTGVPLGTTAPPARPARPVHSASQKVPPAGKEVDKPPEQAYITLKDCTEEFTDDERNILLALEERILLADELTETLELPARRVLSALTMLQMRGFVDEQPGRRFTAMVRLKKDGADL